MNEKTWLEKKSELESQLKDSYKRCIPMIVSCLIALIGLFIIPVPTTPNGLMIHWLYLVFYMYLVYKTTRFLKAHHKINTELNKLKDSDPYK